MNPFTLKSLAALLGCMATLSAWGRPAVQVGTDSREKNEPVSIRLNDGMLGLRYKLATDREGVQTTTLQNRAVLDVTVSFYNNRVRLDFQSGTGDSFAGSWNDTGIGTVDDPKMRFHIRRLSMTLNPIQGLEMSVGSMAPVYGAGSEDTYFDSDGYIMGYRVRAAFDQGDLVVTGGYVGDYKDPNVFDRWNRMGELNYIQAVLTRSIGEILKASIEYDRIAGYSYARGALRIDVSRWTKLLDAVQVENMTRVSRDAGNVLALQLSRKFKALFGTLDLDASVAYIYRTDEIDIPLGDKVFFGQSMRVSLKVPALISASGGQKLGAYADYIQGITDLDQLRFEVGMFLRF